MFRVPYTFGGSFKEECMFRVQQTKKKVFLVICLVPVKYGVDEYCDTALSAQPCSRQQLCGRLNKRAS